MLETPCLCQNPQTAIKLVNVKVSSTQASVNNGGIRNRGAQSEKVNKEHSLPQDASCHSFIRTPIFLFKQDPLEAILVIFGRRALIFLFV